MTIYLKNKLVNRNINSTKTITTTIRLNRSPRNGSFNSNDVPAIDSLMLTEPYSSSVLLFKSIHLSQGKNPCKVHLWMLRPCTVPFLYGRYSCIHRTFNTADTLTFTVPSYHYSANTLFNLPYLLILFYLPYL